MYENERTARVGVERSSGKKKQPLDHLTRDVLAAEKAGMSYGQWKAAHPHTYDVDEDMDDELQAGSTGTVKTCPVCGKRFTVEQYQTMKVYCSDKCRERKGNAVKSQRRGVEHSTRRCAVCGKEFVQRDHRNIFCSQECRDEAQSAKEKEERLLKRPPKTLTCPTCGGTFTTRLTRKVHCSIECRKRSQADKAKARREAKLQEEKEND